jgi:hypothetical protein
VWVRAQDAGGAAATQTLPLVVDNWGPTPFFPLTFTPDVSSHVKAGTPVTVQWTPPTDGSGSVTLLAAVDQQTNTIPTQAISGASYTTSFPSAGQWYIHLAARDSAGNLTMRHYGPWFVEASGP